jgi:predicted permease
LGTQEYTILDWRVLGFVLGVAVLTGLVFGVLPAWLIGRLHPSPHPVRDLSPAHGAGVRRMRATLVVVQAAVTVVLVAGSLSLGRGFLKLLGTDLGFRTDRVVTLNVSLTGTRHEAAHLARQYYREALDRLRTLPGVESAGAVRNLPLTDNISTVTGFKLDSGQFVPSAEAIPASPDYFRSIGLEVVEGREFTSADRQDSAPVAILNEALARRLGVSSGMVGRKLLSYWGPKEFTIVGVVKTVRAAGPSRPGREHFYFPVEQQPPWFITFVARVRGKAERYLAVCREVVQQVDPQVPVYDVKTLDQLLSETLARPRIYTTAILFFGAFALLLAVAGVYGVATYSIAQRTHEIGVRIAVGASPSGLRFLLVRQSLLPMAAGMVAGVAGAIGLGQFLKHLMTSAEPVGAWTCAAAALLLAIAAATAVWTATGRIVQIDPVNALRAE